MSQSLWRLAANNVRSALWTVPVMAVLLGLPLARLLHDLDSRLGWTLAGLSASGARSMLEAILTLTLSFLVFTFGSLLVAIQVASGQLTPRIIATTLLRDNVVRYTVGLFVFSMLFAISALNRLEPVVHQLVLTVAAGLGLASIAAFLFLIDYAARLLRPIAILSRVAEDGLRVIEALYPQPTRGPEVSSTLPKDTGSPRHIIFHSGVSSSILAVDADALIAGAQQMGGIVECIPSVGDFLGKDEPLFALYGDAARIDAERLRAAVTFGTERTMQQDPAFSIRIIVDIALKALSPAINDPTTAVLAIDQLHRLLRTVGNRHLHNDQMFDDAGRLRLILRTPNWEDFVHLAFCEIRQCGATNFQVARRLRAMIENLTLTLPAYRHAALLEQLRLLDHELEKTISAPEDLAVARVPDSQGLGGPAIRYASSAINEGRDGRLGS